jgi:hypothetical protein
LLLAAFEISGFPVFIPRFFSIDQRCEGGRFPVSESFVTISNSDLLSSSETEVNPGMRS